jgi:hypothetical protein
MLKPRKATPQGFQIKGCRKRTCNSVEQEYNRAKARWLWTNN